MSLIKTIVASVWLCLLGATAQAAPENITRGEMAIIPEYCKDAQTFGWQQGFKESPRSPYWVSLMGRSFWDIHHYCWAVLSVHRSRAAGITPQHRDHLHRTAIDDYRYIVNAAKPDMVLLPDIYYHIAESHAFLKEFGAAVDNYNRSREIKPDYWPPYVGHAKILEKAGLTAQAKKVLEEGLRLMPTERALQTPFVRLGGRLADIVPAPTPAPTPAEPSPPEAPAGAASAPQ